MDFVSLLAHYITWHYTRAVKEIFHIEENFLWFLYNFFSVPLLLKTFFAPWKRLSEGYKKGFDVEAVFESFIINTLMRLIGVLLRTFVLLIALASMFAVFVIGLLFLAFWFLLPIILVFLFQQGFIDLLSSLR